MCLIYFIFQVFKFKNGLSLFLSVNNEPPPLPYNDKRASARFLSTTIQKTGRLEFVKIYSTAQLK